VFLREAGPIGRRALDASVNEFAGRKKSRDGTMMQITLSLWRITALAAFALFLSAPFLSAIEKKEASSPASAQKQTAPAKKNSVSAFNDVADQALRAMTKRAEELHIQGAAVVAYFEGDTIQAWSSKMVVVGRMKNLPTEGKPGDNLLGIAYTKASEMADTLKASGSGVRPPMTGEYGWPGGLIAKTKTGYVIAAFSGGPSEDDVKVSQAGLDVLLSHL
jgi:hypothetical protein